MKNKKGFTLVEIMIVVVIIGLLAAMAIPAFQTVRTTSATDAALNDLRQLGQQADIYFLRENETTVAHNVLLTSGMIKSLSTDNTYRPDPILATTTAMTATTAFGTISYQMGQ